MNEAATVRCDSFFSLANNTKMQAIRTDGRLPPSVEALQVNRGLTRPAGGFSV